ncbi:cytochrome P450 86A1-like [Lycium barbarum]|uniref:cytochrome P450 86A1-like n=1 Tax=Lycium barbarum TaxID=112863 RepID=UPI00293F6B0B|nr:cytochrome P450 86A1-like [Lycium barbarum]
MPKQVRELEAQRLQVHSCSGCTSQKVYPMLTVKSGFCKRKIVVPELSKWKLGHALYRWLNLAIKNGLLPILDKASKQNISVDLQDLMIRFGTDNIFGLALGKSLNILTIDLHDDNSIALEMDTTQYEFSKDCSTPTSCGNL